MLSMYSISWVLAARRKHHVQLDMHPSRIKLKEGDDSSYMGLQDVQTMYRELCTVRG